MHVQTKPHPLGHPASGHPLVVAVRYPELRRRLILAEHCPDLASLRVLLRIAESTTSHAKLRALGYEATASPASTSISWQKQIASPDLEAAATALLAAFGRDQVVLDLGARFGESRGTSSSRSEWWPGKLLLNVGGTTRCVIFDRTTSPSELDRILARERLDYEAHEYHPPTE
jgi:hypothetical protein